jgi:serine/threonine protein kinase
MTPSRRRLVESLYRAALEHATADRAAFLYGVCSGDVELRVEVESLLARADSRIGTVDNPFAPGAEIGSYKIESMAGEGGMSIVYKAFDTKLNRPVALKLLSDEVADATARRRFQREAQMASSLNHPHILTVYDAGEIQDRQYLVTEFVDGGTLRDWTKDQKRTWREIAELLTGVADGLAAAHDAKILHRDIKPANILVLKSGYAKLADFGLAKLAEESLGPDEETKTFASERTKPGILIGTVSYMSPEQAEGKAIDARSDIFSFGIVLYELLSARRPFDGRSELETLQKVIHEPTPPLGDDIPAPLQAVVEKALKKNPSDRYQNMRELVADLRTLTHTSEAPRKRPALRYAVGVAVLLFGAAYGAWYLQTPKTPVTNPSEFVQLTNFSDYATAPAISPDGTMVAFFRGGGYFLGTGQVYVKILSSGESKQLTDDSSRKYDPVFTPDGSHIAYTSSDFSTLLWETRTVPVLGGASSQLMRNAAGLSWFAPDRIVFSEIMAGTASHMGIVTARENRSEEREIYFPSHERAMAHYSHPSPDQHSLLVVEMDRVGDWQRCRLMPMDGSSVGAQVGPQGRCRAAGWSPDGKWMYFNVEAAGSSHLWRQRFPDGIAEQITFGPTEEEGLAVAPDGKSLIASIGMRRGSVWLKDATGEHRLSVEGSASRPTFSSDGKRLYYLLRKATSTDSVELWVEDLASGKSDPVLMGQRIMDYDISPDQKNVVFTVRTESDSAIFLAALDRGSAPHLLARDGEAVTFAGNSDIVFRQLDAKTGYLTRIHTDGSGLDRIVGTHVISKMGASPDGEWTVISGLTDPSKPAHTDAVSLRDRSRRTICIGPCLVKWSLDGKFLFVTVAQSPPDSTNTLTYTGRTLVLPLPKGLRGLDIPKGGFGPDSEQELKGIKVIRQGEISPGFGSDTYAYTSGEFQGNLFRIPLH